MSNSLSKVHPELISEWSDRNYPLTPDNITFGSNKIVWWKGSCGHEWQASVKSRTINGTGCPYCSHNSILEGFNDLATTQPKLAEEWSERNLPLTPDMVNDKSRKNVWWKCKECGYEWKSVIHSRVKGTTCPVCADRAVLSGHNDLATTDRHLLKEWDYKLNKDILPTQVSRNSMRSVWWKCSNGHSWKAKICERTIEEKGCTICENEYQSVFPQLAICFYARMKGLQTLLNSDTVIGLPLETYIPDEKLAIESECGTDDIEILKEHICKARGINLIKIPYKTRETEVEYALKLKQTLLFVKFYESTFFTLFVPIIHKFSIRMQILCSQFSKLFSTSRKQLYIQF